MIQENTKGELKLHDDGHDYCISLNGEVVARVKRDYPGLAKQFREAPRLYEALKGLLSLHDEDCKMLARGIGTATPGGGKILRAILAIKAVEGK